MASAVDPHAKGLLTLPLNGRADWVTNHGPPQVDIVAVHGLNGGRWSTWSKGDVMWLQHYLLEKMPQARVMTFGYQADVLHNNSVFDVRDHARRLISLLRNQRDEQETRELPIVFVCHSLGGIVVKQALRFAANESTYNGIATHTKGIVFFGTPHRGADLAFWGDYLAKVAKLAFLKPKSEFIKNLRTNDKTLMNISEDFRSIVSKYAITSFYEEEEVSGVGQVVVPKHSALMEVPHEEAIPFEGNHMEMCKFSGGIDNEKFTEVLKAIKRIIATAPAKHTAKQIEYLSAFSMPESESDMEHMIEPLEGTCKWILNHSTYRRWSNTATAAILHITGKPGSGKSVLSSFCFKNAQIQKEWSAVNYFSFRGDTSQLGIDAVYASFSKQLLFQVPQLFSAILSEYGENFKKSSLSKDDVKRVFEKLAQTPTAKRLLFIIDGLDECKSQSKEFFTFIHYITKKRSQVKVLVLSRPEAHIVELVAPAVSIDVDAEQGLQNDLNHYISAGIESLIEKRGRGYLPLKKTISRSLRQRADGMFLLVKLILDDLSGLTGSTPANVTRVLASLPRTLEQAYENALRQVKPQDRDWARCVITWLLFSTRPLTVEELASAQALTSDASTVNGLELHIPFGFDFDLRNLFGPLLKFEGNTVRMMHQSAKDFLVKAGAAKAANLQSNPQRPCEWYEITTSEGAAAMTVFCIKATTICRERLVEIAKLSHLSHESFTGGLLDSNSNNNAQGRKDPARDNIQDKNNNEHNQNAASDINYDDDTDSGSSMDEGEEENFIEACRFSLLDYAVDNLPEHARQAALGDQSTQMALTEFLESDRYHSSPWEKSYWLVRDPSRESLAGSPIHLACILGLDKIIPKLLKNWSIESPDSKRRTPLDLAVEGGKESTVKLLLGLGASVGAIQKDGTGMPLWTAAQLGHSKIVEILLENGADPMQCDGYARTLFDITAAAGSLTVMKMLIDKKIGRERLVFSLSSALRHAAEESRLSMMSFLLEGNWFEAATERQNTLNMSLIAAIRNGHVDAAKLLLEKGELLAIQREGFGHPLHLAVLGGHPSMVKFLLLDKGVEVNTQRYDNKTAVHLSIQSPATVELGNKYAEILKLLIKRGAKLNERDTDGNTPLHLLFHPTYSAYSLSVSQYQESFVRLLLKGGAKLDIKNNEEKTVLDYALNSGTVAGIKLCSEHRVGLLGTDDMGQNALHKAASAGSAETLELLLNKTSLDINSKDTNDRTPLHLAARCGRNQIGALYFLLNHGADVNLRDVGGMTALHCVLEAGDSSFPLVKALIEKNADVNAEDSDKRTPIAIAIQNREFDVVFDLLVENGASINVEEIARGLSDTTRNSYVQFVCAAFQKEKEELARAILLRASLGKNRQVEAVQAALGKNSLPLLKLIMGHVDIATVRSLLRIGLFTKMSDEEIALYILDQKDIDISIPHSYPPVFPLTLAARNGYLRVAQKMLELGAPINNVDSNGRSALWHAASSGQSSLVRILLAFDADASIRDAEGVSALEAAEKNGNMSVVEILGRYEEEMIEMIQLQKMQEEEFLK